jgi:hypothetical protein
VDDENQKMMNDDDDDDDELLITTQISPVGRSERERKSGLHAEHCPFNDSVSSLFHKCCSLTSLVV